MPRSKKRRGAPQRAGQPFSDEDVSIETLSHCSSFSDSASLPEEGGDGMEDGVLEDFQYKLKGFIDSTVDKSAKTRQGALDGLKTAMATKILYEFILERRMTITDSIERCLKKGKGEEQGAAASLACLLCIQLGSGIESEEVFKTLKPVFKNILNDGSANLAHFVLSRLGSNRLGVELLWPAEGNQLRAEPSVFPRKRRGKRSHRM